MGSGGGGGGGEVGQHGYLMSCLFSLVSQRRVSGGRSGCPTPLCTSEIAVVRVAKKNICFSRERVHVFLSGTVRELRRGDGISQQKWNTRITNASQRLTEKLTQTPIEALTAEQLQTCTVKGNTHAETPRNTKAETININTSTNTSTKTETNTKHQHTHTRRIKTTIKKKIRNTPK